MGFKKVAKRGFFFGLNPLRWAGADQLKENGHVLKQLTDRLFHPNSVDNTASPHRETFEECLQRLGMDEEALKKRMKTARTFVRVCLGLSAVLLLYSFYLFASHLILSGLVTLILFFLLLAYVFREHFNYFQMKERRLGCTFKEWFNSLWKQGSSS
ncbi:MAG: hypothetical protein A3F41_05165 [Coxiella sp. RIFCSPHIGHO2_12_FULL_44_14]|nr:MAG: hypothetical protein A3F41_05165 [Coxiella sp. RIFCSPHIGHO2_12_FULL_44_14]